jgi:REP element-mobilizing transposase RayT
MVYNHETLRRKSIRLERYDYSQAGAYFITLCTQDWKCLFGKIINHVMQTNETGQIVSDSWQWLEKQYDHVELDEWIIMPNHVHGIILITNDDTNDDDSVCRGGSRTALSEQDNSHGNEGSPTALSAKRKPIGRLIGAFKTVSTKHMNELRHTPGKKLWQRNYWEHIVRNESELNRIREYIYNNPKQWELDKLYPGKGGSRTAPTIHEPVTEYSLETWMI